MLFGTATAMRPYAFYTHVLVPRPEVCGVTLQWIRRGQEQAPGFPHAVASV